MTVRTVRTVRTKKTTFILERVYINGRYMYTFPYKETLKKVRTLRTHDKKAHNDAKKRISKLRTFRERSVNNENGNGIDRRYK